MNVRIVGFRDESGRGFLRLLIITESLAGQKYEGSSWMEDGKKPNRTAKEERREHEFRRQSCMH